MLITSASVDRPCDVENPVKVDLTGGDVDICETQPGEFRISLRMRGRLTVLEEFVTVSSNVTIKQAQLET